MAGRLLWQCVLLLVLDIHVDGEPLRWNIRPSTVNHTIDLAQFSTCHNSIATMDVANAEDTLSYSLVDQKPDGKFVLYEDKVYCNQIALRSNGHSSYILSVNVTDGVTYVSDNFTVTVIGLPRTTQSIVSTTGVKQLASSVQSTSSLTVTAKDGWTNGSTMSHSVSVPITIKTATTGSIIPITGAKTLTGRPQSTSPLTETATYGGTNGSTMSHSVSVTMTTETESSSTNVGLIVGIVFGVVGIIIAGIVIYVVWQWKIGKRKYQPSAATDPKHSVEFTNFEYEHTDLGGSYIGAGGEVHVSVGGAPTTVGDSKGDVGN